MHYTIHEYELHPTTPIGHVGAKKSEHKGGPAFTKI